MLDVFGGEYNDSRARRMSSTLETHQMIERCIHMLASACNSQ